MRIKNLLLMLTIVSTFFSCGKDTPSPATTPPVASFVFSGAGAAPSTVTFTNQSTNATSFIWDFGDNSKSYLQNTTHTYLTSGVYDVKLTATGAGGTNSANASVNIGAAYTKFIITKFKVTAFPSTKLTGADWDVLVLPAFKYPDLYFKIIDSVLNVKLDNSATVIDDVQQSNLPVWWTPIPTYSSTLFNATRFFDLYDEDGVTDDNIGYVGFKMSNYMSTSNPYPTLITATQNGITIELSLSWQ